MHLVIIMVVVLNVGVNVLQVEEGAKPCGSSRVSARRQKPNHTVERAAIVKTGVCVGANACFMNRQIEF